MGEVIPFARAVMQAAAGPWTQAERSELARLAAAITRDGRAGYDVASGRGDGGEPWFAISMPTSGETVLHVARIGGRFIVHHVADDLAEEGHDLRALVRRAMRDVGDNIGGLGPGAAVLLLLAQAVLDAPSAQAETDVPAPTVESLPEAAPSPVGEAVEANHVDVAFAAAPPTPIHPGEANEAPAAAGFVAPPVTGAGPGISPFATPAFHVGAAAFRLPSFGDSEIGSVGKPAPPEARDAAVTAGAATKSAASAKVATDEAGAQRLVSAAATAPVAISTTVAEATKELTLAVDRLFGTVTDDQLDGGIDNDWIFAGSGNDTLVGGDGSDTLIGGDGNDTLIGDDDIAAIEASLDPAPTDTEETPDPTTELVLPGPVEPDNDTMDGGDGDDFFWGGRGEDAAWGGAGRDTMFGGLGNDSLFGDAGDDWVLGGAGDDRLAAGGGRDKLFGGTGNDSLFGGSGADLLNGDAGHDRLAGGAGRDFVNGGIGDDTLLGGDGADHLNGGDDNDWIDGGGGRDSVAGGNGDDTLAGGGGLDTLDGGAGDDVLTIGPGTVARGGSGADLFIVDFQSVPPLLDGFRHAMIVDYNRDEGDEYRLLDPEHTTVLELPPEVLGEAGRLLITWGPGPVAAARAEADPASYHVPAFLHFDWID